MITSFSRRVALAILSGLLSSLTVMAATGIDEMGMNKSVVPGDDFYGYANGAWTNATEIPADRGNWGTGAALGEETNLRLVALIEAAAKNHTTATVAERIAGDYYTAYMDEAGIEEPRSHAAAAAAARHRGDPATRPRWPARSAPRVARADVDPLNNTVSSRENLFGLWVAAGPRGPGALYALSAAGRPRPAGPRLLSH